LIQEHPFFGEQLAYFKLDDMRQGIGLIDFVNTYAEVAVFYGLVGLAIFVTFFLVGLYKAYRAAKRALRSDPELAQLGVSLFACIAATLLMLVTASFINSYQVISYVLVGLAAAYANLCKPSLARAPIAPQRSNVRAS
jgi:O-antigen ligase